MSSGTAATRPQPGAWARRLEPALGAVVRGALRLEQVRPLHVVAGFVVVEWLVTLGLALAAAHNGWVYYQGGDQVWFYTTSWLLGHGQIPDTKVGYGWSVLLMPLTLVGGPNLLQVMPAILLLNVLVLMPIAMAAIYGIGERLGGRLFGYWVLVVWIVAPLVGIRYTNAGFHERFTDLTLPAAFGLTALSDFPALVALTVAAYFLVRTIQRFSWPDAALAGGVTGFALGIKPSNGLFLGGAALALLAARHRRAALGFACALVPGVLVLAFWKWRGLGYLPLFGSAAAPVRVAAGSSPLPLGALDLHKYLFFDWGHVQDNLDSVREYFWSVRVFEWLVIAGIVGLARRALWAAGLFGGWFLAFALIKGSDQYGNVNDTSLLRMLIPAIPAFVLMLASLPLLVPGVAGRLRRPAPPRAWGSRRTVKTGLAAAGILFVAIPTALAGAAHRIPDESGVVVNRETAPIPTDAGIRLHAAVSGGRVVLSWPPAHVAAGKVFYTVMRGGGCSSPHSIDTCTTRIAAATKGTRYADTPPGPGTYVYTVGVSTNWQDDPTGGDPYVAARPLAVTVP